MLHVEAQTVSFDNLRRLRSRTQGMQAHENLGTADDTGDAPHHVTGRSVDFRNEASSVSESFTSQEPQRAFHTGLLAWSRQ